MWKRLYLIWRRKKNSVNTEKSKWKLWECVLLCVGGWAREASKAARNTTTRTLHPHHQTSRSSVFFDCKIFLKSSVGAQFRSNLASFRVTPWKQVFNLVQFFLLNFISWYIFALSETSSNKFNYKKWLVSNWREKFHEISQPDPFDDKFVSFGNEMEVKLMDI